MIQCTCLHTHTHTMHTGHINSYDKRTHTHTRTDGSHCTGVGISCRPATLCYALLILRRQLAGLPMGFATATHLAVHTRTVFGDSSCSSLLASQCCICLKQGCIVTKLPRCRRCIIKTGKKCSFSAAEKQCGRKWELQLPIILCCFTCLYKSSSTAKVVEAASDEEKPTLLPLPIMKGCVCVRRYSGGPPHLTGVGAVCAACIPTVQHVYPIFAQIPTPTTTIHPSSRFLPPRHFSSAAQNL